MNATHIDEALMYAVSAFDVAEVKKCLDLGANPSFRRARDEDEPDGLIQPTTPLRLVMFRISDSLLEDDDLKKFGEIARILVDAGADPKPAIKIAESRYGTFDPTIEGNLFMDVWRVVATGK